MYSIGSLTRCFWEFAIISRCNRTFKRYSRKKKTSRARVCVWQGVTERKRLLKMPQSLNIADNLFHIVFDIFGDTSSLQVRTKRETVIECQSGYAQNRRNWQLDFASNEKGNKHSSTDTKKLMAWNLVENHLKRQTGFFSVNFSFWFDSNSKTRYTFAIKLSISHVTLSIKKLKLCQTNINSPTSRRKKTIDTSK